MKAAPAYQRISNDLRQDIAASYKPGDFLPAESALAERFSVNRHTVRRALQTLTDEGLLLRSQGRGTMVVGRPIEYRISEKTRFTESIQAQGMAPAGELVRARMSSAPEEAARALGIEPGDEVVKLQQLRRANNVPIMASKHYLPKSFAWLLDEFHGGSLHAAIKGRLGINLRQMETTVKAVLPTQEEATALHLSRQHPVLQVHAHNIDTKDSTPLEYFEAAFRGDAISFTFIPSEWPDAPSAQAPPTPSQR